MTITFKTKKKIRKYLFNFMNTDETKQKNLEVGSIVRLRETPSLRAKVLASWQSERYPDETFYAVDFIKNDGTPDKRFWRNFGCSYTHSDAWLEEEMFKKKQ